ncbi:MAG: sn-glycerol-3-phosphate ABC transporter ATP-binding protein UgpC [Anaerolineae bacterium]|nr:sn-glycerol-3-phosphate ABC transporter ATP-binding protein UgpC [Anaerolineae bacterium]
MASVTFEHVTKNFGKVVAVRDLTLHIEDKEFLVFVGPSGCGKSTILRLIAGLEEPTEGKIYIGDRLVNDVPPKDRDVAMVFQSYALYPHMNVFDNMAFGLKLRKFPKHEIERRVREAARILEIEDLLHRKPRELSGGQRQRVALGRAIVREPKVFLLDEPLSNLDAKLRVQTRAELIKLHQRLQTTFVYVTHDQMEAMTMGTRIAVLKDGVLQQVDTPQKLYKEPANLFVAGFIGSPSMNFFEAVVAEEDGKLVVDAGTFRVQIPDSKREKALPLKGKKVIFGIRPEHIYAPPYVPPGISAASVRAEVDITELMGNEIFLYLLSGKNRFLARVDPRVHVRPGEIIEVVMDMENMHLFDAVTEKALLH